MQQTNVKRVQDETRLGGEVIHKELCKKLKFYHITKRHMHKPEPIQKKETHKLLLDFELQIDHLIPSDSQKKKERE